MHSSFWYNMTVGKIVQILKTNLYKGLFDTEVIKRREKYGPNKITEEKKRQIREIFTAQFKDFMVITLLVAAIISTFLGEIVDAVTIIAIVILNAVLGFIQEYRAEKSITALKQLSAPEACVIRGGQVQKILAEDLVPGDIVNLETGNRIPADVRLVETLNLELDEAILTGESVPVKKGIDTIREDKVALGDQLNMAFMGTLVTRGRGQGIVVETGMKTELGKVAGMIQGVKIDETPLQKRLEQIGKVLVAGCLLVCVLVVLVGIWRGESLYHMFLLGVSLAVAAIPEGLPAIVTVALAVGVQRMIKRRAIIRKLPAVETLGCATVICSDKTGTLTQNEMTVRKIYLPGMMLEVTGEGYAPYGKFMHGESTVNPQHFSNLQVLLKIAALCNNARLEIEDSNHNIMDLFRKPLPTRNWRIIGDPTEGALITLANKGGINPVEVEKSEQRIIEHAFESDRKRMSVVYKDLKGGLNSYVKGAPDIILERCTRILVKGQVHNLDRAEKEKILSFNHEMAKEALRVLALAYRPLHKQKDLSADKVEEDLIFVGLVGMIDPPRLSAKRAVQAANNAGIRPIMITGDHPATALAVARELDIARDNTQLISGIDLDNLSDWELAERIDSVRVFARVSPAHKVRIVRVLKRKGHVVAMTGDGINDAPAVKEADIGISMGKTGTDVTKEASAMVLADDNFATIVAAVEEGRGIYDNIRKFIRYLLGCNIGEVLTMFLAPVIGLPLPLLPTQILWINLVTDGLPAMALGVDKGDDDIMERPPRPPQESIFARGLGRRIIWRGIEIALGTLLVFTLTYSWNGGSSDALKLAQTSAFCTLVFLQLTYVFECRSENRTVFNLGLLSNPFLVLAVVLSTVMQLSVVYLPGLGQLFGTVPLGKEQWLIILVVAGARQLINLSRYIFVESLGRKLVFWKVKTSS